MAHLNRRIRRATLSLALAASLACAVPASRPAERPVRETVQVLTDQGHAALEAEDKQASLDAFLDAWQLLRTDRQLPPADPLRVHAAHGLAVAYFRAGRVDKAGDLFKANETLDKALAAPATAPRPLVINRTVLDLTQKFNVMRAVKTTREYLAAHPEELDETIVNLLGTALNIAADDRFAATPLFAEASKVYEQQAARLEEAHPGQKRWGVEWVSNFEYQRRSFERNRLVDAYKAAVGRQETARREFNDRERQVDDEKRKRKMGYANSLDGAIRSRDLAAERLATADRAAADAKKAIPALPWLTSFQTVLPNDATVVAIATPKAPMIRPPQPANDPPPDPGPIRKSGGPLKPPVPADPPVAPANPPPVVEAPKPARVTRYSAAFPVAPDLLITTAAAVERAERIGLEDSQGNVFTATLVRTDEKTGLALVRVEGQKFAFLNLAAQYAGGTDLKCTGFPKVSIFAPAPESIPGRSAAIKPNDAAAWSVSLSANPRLAGAPLMTANGELVGVAMAQRESAPAQIPAVRLDALRAFLGQDAPNLQCVNADPSFVFMLTATVGK